MDHAGVAWKERRGCHAARMGMVCSSRPARVWQTFQGPGRRRTECCRRVAWVGVGADRMTLDW